ncbi:MAG: hypothetical protein ACE37H_04255 [Phycisphaeraceae bacterium]
MNSYRRRKKRERSKQKNVILILLLGGSALVIVGVAVSLMIILVGGEVIGSAMTGGAANGVAVGSGPVADTAIPKNFTNYHEKMIQLLLDYESDVKTDINETEEEIKRIERGKAIDLVGDKSYYLKDGEYIFYRYDVFVVTSGGLDKYKNIMIEKQKTKLDKLRDIDRKFSQGIATIPSSQEKQFAVGQFLHPEKTSFAYFEVQQIISNDSALGYWVSDDNSLNLDYGRRFLLIGYDFSNSFDGQKLQLHGWHYITETYTYVNVNGGTSTVLKLHAMTQKDVDELLKAFNRKRK